MCFSDVFSFSLHRAQENITQNILIPLLSSVNVFTYTEKGQRFREIFKTIKFSFYLCTEFPYHFVTSINSFYKLFKMPFCKKNDVSLTYILLLF